MLSMDTLRTALQKVFGVDDKYLVPLGEGGYVPTYDKTDTTSTWIGYRVLSKTPVTRTQIYNDENGKEWFIRNCDVVFRISFIGPQAEDLADLTLMWEERTDVRDAFEQSSTQIHYNRREQFSYPMKEGGLNDGLCWCVDFEAASYMAVAAGWKHWDLAGIILHGDITIPYKENEHGRK